MKPTHAPQATPEAPVRVEFQVQFSGGPKGRRRVREHTTPPIDPGTGAASAGRTAPTPNKEISFGRLPKTTRLLVLAHFWENLVRQGAVKNYADIARLTGLSRARVTQIANLTLLSPDLQGRILFPAEITGEKLHLESHLRRIVALAAWVIQRKVFEDSDSKMSSLRRRPDR